MRYSIEVSRLCLAQSGLATDLFSIALRQTVSLTPRWTFSGEQTRVILGER